MCEISGERYEYIIRSVILSFYFKWKLEWDSLFESIILVPRWCIYIKHCWLCVCECVRMYVSVQSHIGKIERKSKHLFILLKHYKESNSFHLFLNELFLELSNFKCYFLIAITINMSIEIEKSENVSSCVIWPYFIFLHTF